MMMSSRCFPRIVSAIVQIVTQSRRLLLLGILLPWIASGRLLAQDPPPTTTAPATKNTSPPIVIPEDRPFVEVLDLYPSELVRRVSIRFQDANADEINTWMEAAFGLGIVVETNEDLPANRTWTVELRNEPLFLLLDRLAEPDFQWEFDGELVRFRSVESLLYMTRQYEVGDLLDQGFGGKLEKVLRTIMEGTADEDGDIRLLGDMLFSSLSFQGQVRVEAFLRALREHGKRTMVLDGAFYESIEQRLGKKIEVDFFNKPLPVVIEELSAALDLPLVLAESIRSKSGGHGNRSLVNYRCAPREGRIILEQILNSQHLTQHIKHQEIVIDASDEDDICDESVPIAVLDVRDLVLGPDETAPFLRALTSQVSANWVNDGGVDEPIMIRPGTLVIRASYDVIRRSEQLIAMYRIAMAKSKNRLDQDRVIHDREKMVTRYYRISSVTADDLVHLLPILVPSGNWETPESSNQPASVVRVRSGKRKGEDEHDPQIVLIITQKSKVHDEFREVLNRISTGDEFIHSHGEIGSEKFPSGGMGGMGGGMGGGFGGGMF